MRILATIILTGLLAAGIAACGGEATESPTVAGEATQAPTMATDTTPASPPTAAASVAPTNTPTDPPEPTDTPASARTDTQAPTDTPMPEPTSTDAPEPTAMPTPSPEPTSTDAPEPTAEPTPSPDPTAMPEPEPESGAVDVALAPLGDNLLWVAHYDNATSQWSVYDPSGTFTVDELFLPPGQSAEDLTSLEELTELVAGQIYWLKVEDEQTVSLGGKGRALISGVNPVVW